MHPRRQQLPSATAVGHHGLPRPGLKRVIAAIILLSYLPLGSAADADFVNRRSLRHSGERRNRGCCAAAAKP